MKVMIVERVELVRFARTRLFAGAGHDVTSVPSPQTAIRCMRHSGFDVMLIDPFQPEAASFAPILVARAMQPACHFVLQTASRHFPRGELFTLLPADITILHSCADDDLLAICEERLLVRECDEVDPITSRRPKEMRQTNTMN